MSEVIDADSVGVELIDPIDWEEYETLRPGVDFHAGVTFFTLPAKVKVEKEVKRNRKTETVIEVVDQLVVVDSEGRQFPYTEENVGKLGFQMPRHVTLDDKRRWSRDGIVTFLKGDYKVPDPSLVFTGIRQVYEEYVEFARQEWYDVMPLFVMGTYLFRLFKSTGYIHFNGTAASGKSQNLRILEALAFNTVWASSMSAAALYRQLAGFPGTILLDEAEGFDGERGEELRRILNAGYLDGQAVRRAEKGKNDQFEVVAFESYGPKVLASINPLDQVIGSRCLVVGMRPAIRMIGEFNKDDPRWQRIRDRLYLWTMTHGAAISDLVIEWNETIRHERAPRLAHRHWQITQTYIVLADYIDRAKGGDLCDRMIAFFSEYFAESQKAQDATDRVRLVLKTLPRVLEAVPAIEGGWYYIKTIHEHVSSYLEDDQREYYKTRNVGKHLDVLGFKKKRSHKQGTQVWLDPDAIRQEFLQRRVEPNEEDLAWLEGKTDYTPSTPTPEPTAPDMSVWGNDED